MIERRLNQLLGTAAVVLATVALGGCGGDDPERSQETVELTCTEMMDRYSPEELPDTDRNQETFQRCQTYFEDFPADPGFTYVWDTSEDNADAEVEEVPGVKFDQLPRAPVGGVGP